MLDVRFAGDAILSLAVSIDTIPHMILNEAQQRKLDRVVDATNRLDAAREALDEAKRVLDLAVVDALHADIPDARVAEASGQTRMALWRRYGPRESRTG
jgi:hypothetical protein